MTPFPWASALQMDRLRLSAMQVIWITGPVSWLRHAQRSTRSTGFIENICLRSEAIAPPQGTRTPVIGPGSNGPIAGTPEAS